MAAAVICRAMGWTWREFEDSPAWFIDVVSLMLRAEADESDKRSKKKSP